MIMDFLRSRKDLEFSTTLARWGLGKLLLKDERPLQIPQNSHSTFRLFSRLWTSVCYAVNPKYLGILKLYYSEAFRSYFLDY
jgi:hypothetical protein